MQRLLRGSSLQGIIAFIQQGLDPVQRARVEAALPTDRVDSKQISTHEYYALERSNELVRAIAALTDDPEKRYELFIQCGRFIAEDAINTFLRLLIKFLKPSLFARKYGDFFRRVHNFGKVQASGIEEHRFVLEMTDVEGYEYSGPICIGFIVHTLGAMGCKDLRVKETISPPPGLQNVSAYRFEVAWS